MIIFLNIYYTYLRYYEPVLPGSWGPIFALHSPISAQASATQLTIIILLKKLFCLFLCSLCTFSYRSLSPNYIPEMRRYQKPLIWSVRLCASIYHIRISFDFPDYLGIDWNHCFSMNVPSLGHFFFLISYAKDHYVFVLSTKHICKSN